MLDAIQPGDKVTILIYAGRGREGTEWKPKSGKAVMRGPYGWVLNMGGQHGTPGIADERNIVAIPRLKFKRNIIRPIESARQQPGRYRH
jgi:hypothetical protein